MDLFPQEHSSLETTAKKKLPRVSDLGGKCAADFETPSERRAFSERLQRQFELQMERDRILAAREALKLQPKEAK